MNSRRIFFWILFIFTLFVVYKSVLGPLLERLLWDGVTPFVASKKSINPQGLALPLLIYFTWRIFKWSRPERVEEERIKEKKIEEERVGKNGYTKLMQMSGFGEVHEIKNKFNLSSVDSPQPSPMSIEEKIADFEKRLNYKWKDLTPEQEDKLEAKFRSAAQLKKWPE